MGWKRIKLGELCRIELGKTPSRSNKSYWDEDKAGNNIWLSIADLPLSDKSIMFDSKEYISNAGAELCKIVPKGTLIVSFKLSLGRLAVTGCDLYTNEAIAALYINDENKIDQNYLSWYLTFFDWDAAAGSDIKIKGKTLNKAKLKEIEIIVPPIAEQKRIVAILDQAFADIEQARAKTEQNLKNARELFESYLQQVFSQRGEGVSLSEITESISDGDHSAPPKSEEGIPFITISNINKLTNEVDFSNTFKVPESYYSSLKATRKPTVGDILYTVTGSYGIPVIVREKKEFCFQRHIGLVRPNKNTNSNWLYYLLMSPQVFKQADEGATGTAQKTVSLKLLRSIQVPKIPLDKQISAVKGLDNMYQTSKELEEVYTAKLTALDELKKSILQKAFSGELTKTLEGEASKGALA